MSIGDKLTRVPTFASKAGIDYVGPQPCTVVYIHSERRFYTVEFRSGVTGETWRESFFFKNRIGRGYTPITVPPASKRS